MQTNSAAWKKIIISIILAIMAFGLVSCGGEVGPQPDIVVWTGMTGEELKVINTITEKYKEESGVLVSVIKVPFSELKIKYQIAAPAGQGPDIIIGPQDWIGFFATAELISPLNKSEFTEEQQELYNPVALQNLYYERDIYGIPISMETIAVIYNKGLVSTPPSTMEELLQGAYEFDDKQQKKYGFFFEITNLYYAWPFLAGYGAQIFGETNGKLDVNKVLLDSPETIQGIRFLESLKSQYKLIPDGATNDMMNGIFFEKNMPFCLNGPWMLSDVRKQGIEFDVIPLPELPNGKMPKPFVGVWAVMLNKQTTKRQKAVSFMHYLNKPEHQKEAGYPAG